MLDNPESWLKAVSEAKNVIEFYLELFDERKDIERKNFAVHRCFAERNGKAGWVKKVAEKLKIKEDAVWGRVEEGKVSASTNGKVSP